LKRIRRIGTLYTAQRSGVELTPGGHGRRHGRRKHLLPGSPVWNDLFSALQSKSGAFPCCFASAQTADGLRKSSLPAAAELGTAIRSGSLLGKGSPLSGAGCVDRDLLCDVQDDRRPGTDLLAERTIVRSFHAVENLVHVTASATDRLCPCRLDDESQHKKEKLFVPQSVWSGHGIWSQPSTKGPGQGELLIDLQKKATHP
jgi:hypothetical protein